MNLQNNFGMKNGGIILEKTSLSFENEGVLNPGCIEKDGFIHMFYRAVAKGNHSSIGYAKLDSENNVIFRMDRPILFPEFHYESQGLEDPRIVYIDGVYYLFYTGFDGINARVAYAESTDLITFNKKGLVSPSITCVEVLFLLNRKKLSEKYFLFNEPYQKIHSELILMWEKDFVLFPRKIRGKFVLLYRVTPGIQLISINSFDELRDIVFWRNYLLKLEDNIVLDPIFWFESKNIGGGAPAIETQYGWLVIYHAVEDKTNIYRACAALLDLEDPRKVIGRLQTPLFSPVEVWEKQGIVNNVVFPTSVIEREGRLYIYYGAGDSCIALKSFDKNLLINALIKSK